MKNKSLFLISFKNFFRDKKNIISVLLISLIFSLVLLCVSFIDSLNKYWDESVTKLVDYRTYVVTFNPNKYNVETAIDRLQNYDHVIKAFSEKGYIINMKIMDDKIVSDKNNSILLIGTIDEPIHIINGKTLNNVGESERPLICAKQFYPFLENAQEDYIASNSIDITNKIDEDINLSFIMSNKIEKFKLIGIYDAKQNHTYGNVCYTRPDIVEKLNDKYQFETFNNPDVDFVYMVIDNVKNEDLVSKEINKGGFNIETPTLRVNKHMGEDAISLMITISSIIIFISIILFIYISIKQVINRQKDYIIMKSSGFSNKQMNLIYITELFLIFLLSILLSMIIFNVLIIYLQNVYMYNKIAFYNFKIRFSSIGIMINTLLSIFICTIMSFYFNKKIKNNYD